MTENIYNADVFYEGVIFEIIKVFGLPYTPFTKRLFQPVFGRAASSAAKFARDLDRVTGEGGYPAGARWFLPHFVKSHEAHGVDIIPLNGPFIIAANHPGSIDAVFITAHNVRDDLKYIISDIQFFRHLPNVRKAFIFAPPRDDALGRMQVIREAIRHLQQGGGLIIFPRGSIEADPAFMPDPDGEFHLWSRSLEIFLKHVPNLQIVTTIVSGVISPAAMKHPITRFRRNRADRQRLAFIYQFSRQFISGKQTFDLSPKVTFGEIVRGANHEHMLA